MKTYVPYHVLDASPWPFTGSAGALALTTGGVAYMHSYKYGEAVMMLGLVMVMATMMVWWSDVMSEATYQGHHTMMVQSGLSYGMLLFMTSEVMFFFAFFWAFFHSSLAPTVEMGGVWPPMGMETLDAFQVPLLNTMVLLTSGATATYAHHAMMAGDSKGTMVGLVMTVMLGGFFTYLQALEYMEAPFTMADSVFGSTFFVATGFHGLHVLMGTMFMAVSLMSVVSHHMSSFHHNGLEASLWYWHFVDVVWLFLYMFMYMWSAA